MKRLNFALAILMVFAALTTAQAADNNVVSYTVLHNYFHNNDAPMPSSPLITTQKDFDEQFGMAAYMGKGGQPTPVNFKKQAVLAIVLPVTNKLTDIDSVSVKQSGKNELTLAYTVHEGAEMGYSIQPVFLMSINKRYKNFKVNVVPTVRHEVSTSSSTYESYSYTDSRHSIYMNVDYPVKGNDALVKAIHSYLADRLGKVASCYNLSDERPQVIHYNAKDAKDLVSHYAMVIADSMDKMDKAAGTYGNPNHCSLTAKITRTFENGRFVSYEANGYMYMGGAHGLGFCDGVTFDKATGKQVTLVKSSPDLLKLVDKRLHRDLELDSTFHFNVEPLPMPQATPYVVDNGKIKFVYQHYEIGAYALGMPECEFYPYEIENYLTEEGKALMY